MSSSFCVLLAILSSFSAASTANVFEAPFADTHAPKITAESEITFVVGVKSSIEIEVLDFYSSGLKVDFPDLPAGVQQETNYGSSGKARFTLRWTPTTAGVEVIQVVATGRTGLVSRKKITVHVVAAAKLAPPLITYQPEYQTEVVDEEKRGTWKATLGVEAPNGIDAIDVQGDLGLCLRQSSPAFYSKEVLFKTDLDIYLSSTSYVVPSYQRELCAGTYELRVIVRDKAGQSATADIVIFITFQGRKYVRYKLGPITKPNVPVLTATYDDRDGRGEWDHCLDEIRKRETELKETAKRECIEKLDKLRKKYPHCQPIEEKPQATAALYCEDEAGFPERIVRAVCTIQLRCEET